MFEYNSKYCVMGMCSKRYEVLGDWQGLRKNRNNAISFYTDFNPDYEKVFYAYIYSKPACKSSKETQIVSVFNEEFFALEGAKYRELRETRNKFDRLITVRDYCHDDVMGLIDTWKDQRADVYGWHCHAGYDCNFFERWYESEQSNLISYFYYLGDKIVGYSVLHRAEDSYEYLIRKVDVSLRNTCLYVDFATFRSLWEIERKPFYVNWGASGGGVLKYKKKFPVHCEVPVYFYSVKKDQ